MKSTILFSIAFIIGLVIMPIVNLQACAMTSVICNATYLLSETQCELGDFTSSGESLWLKQQGSANPHGHGALFYHKSGYPGHDYTVLNQVVPVDTVYNSDNHVYRKSGNIADDVTNMFQFVLNAKNKQGKIFMGHDRKRTDGPFGAYAPYVYRYVSQNDTIDYSFAHHGSIDKIEMMEHLTDFDVWLQVYYPGMHDNPDDHVDSEYIFMWIIKNVIDNNGDVKTGMMNALREIRYTPHINSDAGINIFFSDGKGVYAYTNHFDTEGDVRHCMSYKENVVSSILYSYLVRSWNQVPTGWTSMQYNTGDLIYFPTTGKRQIYKHIDEDINVTNHFTLKSGINWIGFPILHTESGTPNAMDPDDALTSVNSYASNLQTKAPGQPNTSSWDFTYSTYLWNSNAILNRANGYILTMGTTSPTYDFFAHGAATSYDQELSFYASYETWVPYYITYSQAPSEAFGTNFQYVTAVSAQDWYIYKFKNKWYGYLEQGATGTFDYGKMYKVTVSQNFSMVWQHFGQQMAFQKAIPENFTAIETPSYQAVEIDSISGISDIKEIGAFKNGVCVGASVVDSYPIHLQVYDEASPELLEYQIITESKSAGNTSMAIARKNITLKAQSLRDGISVFSILSLNSKDIETDIPLPQIRTSAYPNPFNANISISLETSKDSQTEVTVFNVKGEKVETIYNDMLTKGSHDFTWNGYNSAGMRLSSGIYFYKVRTDTNTLTRKIVLVR